ncbi:MAG: hypothetical protein KF871_10895 [Hydrogenophaga sp.]|uniref:hypothetical protein n=1 Tax=Hydrogenophaga sp. TaxID=1904254 RepID=UPI001D617BB7|nr:hypothetical protein [Hydrogenophaga sp.]MBX3610389.1 hypothetical protein [Hydrogenophaga sp.]
MNRLIPLVAVLITRDAMTILPRDLPEHELPIAQAVFGEDNVEVKGPVDGETVKLDVTQEADRLAGKYGADALEKAYGTNFKGAITKACGSLGELAPDDGDETPSKPLAEMTKAELVAHAEAEGIAIDPDASKAKILEAIRAAA